MTTKCADRLGALLLTDFVIGSELHFHSEVGAPIIRVRAAGSGLSLINVSIRAEMLHNGSVPDSATRREEQRRQTRARVLDAAIVEFQRAGTSSADINAIARSAGVARSTFYFHFPTKEHVLLELIRRDEAHLTEELGRFLDTRHDLPAVLKMIVKLVLALESRWGAGLFRDVISLYFSPTRPEPEQWTNHPLFVLLAAEIERSRIRGELYEDVDASHSAAFFLIGVHALLTTVGESTTEREEALANFVRSSLRSMQPHRTPAPDE